MPKFSLAIDGPAGSGKSTISQNIAKKLNWIHIDTGAMYRAVTLKALNLGIDLHKESEYGFLDSTTITYQNDAIYLDGVDVTSDIRSDNVTNNVSLVSSFAYVRKMMRELQQKSVENLDKIIMDGRDIGTVVLPNATLKIFLTANINERARRRLKENQKKGLDENISQVINNLIIRDEKDSTRAESPLRMADDAILIDTTNLSIEEVSEKIIELIHKKEKTDGLQNQGA